MAGARDSAGDSTRYPARYPKRNATGNPKGMLHEAQEMVLEAIDAKFGACPEEIRKRIMAIEDRTKLKALLKEILLKSKLEDISLN